MPFTHALPWNGLSAEVRRRSTSQFLRVGPTSSASPRNVPCWRGRSSASRVAL